MYFLRPENIGAKQKILFAATKIWEMACAQWHFFGKIDIYAVKNN